MRNTAGSPGQFVAMVAILALIAGTFSVPAHAQAPTTYTFTSLHNFNGSDGSGPSTLVLGRDGNFYGTTLVGGAHGAGSLFKISPNGVFQSLYSFCSQPNCADGTTLFGQISIGKDGNFYGTTFQGGTNPGCEYQGGCGTVFKITPAGSLTTLYSFAGADDGGFSYGGVVQGKDGNFYGTTAYAEPNGGGTVFKLTPSGGLTTLYSFCSQPGCADGSTPQANLVQDATGTFYGSTKGGGLTNGGTVFKITPAGQLTTLHKFCAQRNCPDGSVPVGSLLPVGNGTFYGTTYSGGMLIYGTIYSITSTGTFRTLHLFDLNNGANPYDALIKGNDGAFYGTTAFGGTKDDGTIFRLAQGGTFTVLHSFVNSDGFEPQSSLVLGTDGNFYGTTLAGGTSGYGTVFRLSPN